MNIQRIWEVEIFCQCLCIEDFKAEVFEEGQILGFVSREILCDTCEGQGVVYEDYQDCDCEEIDCELCESEEIDCEDCEGQGVVYEDTEVLNYFFVSNWLARQLEEKGEYIGYVGAMNVWHNTDGSSLIDILTRLLKDD